MVLHEGGEPNALVDLFDAEFLTGEDLAKIDFPPVEADSPARRDWVDTPRAGTHSAICRSEPAADGAHLNGIR